MPKNAGNVRASQSFGPALGFVVMAHVALRENGVAKQQHFAHRMGDGI